MKYTKTNHLASATIANTNVTSQLSATSNMLTRNTLQSYVASQLASGITISFTIATAQTFDLVAMANVVGIQGNITIELKLASVSQASQSVAVQTYVQQTYVVAAFDSVSADELVLTFNTPATSGQFEIGYISGAELSQALDPEAFRIAIVSADPFQTSRAGTPETTLTYLIQRLDLTLKKLPFTEMRSVGVELMGAGYGIPRFWYFDEPCIMTGEVVLAVLDAESWSIDPIYGKTDVLASATIGLLEVY